MASRSSKLLSQVQAACRRRNYSYRTEQTYIQWTVRYVRHHSLQHPKELGPAAVRAFLTHLATERKVAASTQNQALSALVFLYDQVLTRATARSAPRQYRYVCSREAAQKAACSPKSLRSRFGAEPDARYRSASPGVFSTARDFGFPKR
jgi:site-specific recombinase XerD